MVRFSNDARVCSEGRQHFAQCGRFRRASAHARAVLYPSAIRLRHNARATRPPLRLQALAVTKAPRRNRVRAPLRSPRCPGSTCRRTGSNLNVEDFLTFRITRLSNALRTHLTKRYLEEFGLSLPEWRLLALVARFAPMRFSEVTSRSSMDKGQVSRTLRVDGEEGLTNMKTLHPRLAFRGGAGRARDGLDHRQGAGALHVRFFPWRAGVRRRCC